MPEAQRSAVGTKALLHRLVTKTIVPYQKIAIFYFELVSSIHMPIGNSDLLARNLLP
jgi:hypothetical protein